MINTCSFGQQSPPIIDWQKSFGGSEGESPKSLLDLGVDGFLLASITSSNDGDLAGNIDQRSLWLLRLDPAGGIIWQQYHGSIPPGDINIKFAPSLNDGYTLVTTIGSYADGIECSTLGNQGWVLEVDSSGEFLVEKCLGGSGNDALSSIVGLPNGYLLCGTTSSDDGDVPNNAGSSDIWTIELSAELNVEESNTMGGSGPDGGRTMIATLDGNYLIGGVTRSVDGFFTDCHSYSTLNNTATVIKVNGTGEVIWRSCFGGNNEDFIHSVAQHPDGTYWVVGTTRSSDGIIEDHNGEIDGWVVRLNQAGEVIENRAFGGSAIDQFFDIQILPDGNALILGNTNSIDGDVSYNAGATDVWLLMVSPELDLIWEKTYGGSDFDFGKGLTVTDDGGVLFYGHSWSSDGDLTSNQGLTDVWVVKLKPLNTGIEGSSASASLVVYPNPAHDVLNIQLEHWERDLQLDIVDAVGRLVWQSPIKNQSGPLQIPINDLVTGSYYLRINGVERTFYARFIKS